jgi:hypothetical protein
VTISTRIAVERAFVSILATAQHPRTVPWPKNAHGVRELEDALSVAAGHGVVFPEEVHLVPCATLPKDTYAAYLLPVDVSANTRWPWRRFLNRFEQIVIRMQEKVLESDEAIVAVLTHEAYELNALHAKLPLNFSISAQELYQLISPGIPGNLHCQAWDAADQRILQCRQKAM